MKGMRPIGVHLVPLIALPWLFAGCAHEKEKAVIRVLSTKAVSLPACPTPTPPMPAEAVRRGIYGVVLVGYSVEPDGRVEKIKLEDDRASPLLFGAVKDWLQQCRGPEEIRSTGRRFSELFSFPPPTGPKEPEEPGPPVDDTTPGVAPPVRSPSCFPDRPPPLLPIPGTLNVEYVVHSDGRVSDVVRKGGDEATATLFKAVRIWLQSCPYTPATRDGKAVPARVAQSFTFSGK